MTEEKTHQDFISTVSHELRTPLTSIRGFAQTMLNSWEMLDDENKKKFLEIIEQQSNRLINLVENMLSISKIQGDENYVFQNYSANKLIEPVIQIIKQQYKTHKFITESNRNIPEILIDKDKFQQIMTNLIENAAKYSEENTSIIIKTDFYNEKFISIKIIDEGIGIKEEDSEKIFKKFSRLDNPLTRKVQGSGLGLFITKTIVEKMNGQISFTSTEGTTTFEVKLPINTIETQARAKCSQKH